MPVRYAPSVQSIFLRGEKNLNHRQASQRKSPVRVTRNNSLGVTVTGSAHESQAIAKLRNLASWYRELAEKAATPWIWEARVLRADDLEREADLLADRYSAQTRVSLKE
jgi:hypothetical protein